MAGIYVAENMISWKNRLEAVVTYLMSYAKC